METINYLSTIAMPAIILIIVFYSFIKKNNVYDIFLDGAKEGVKIVYNIFPTLIGLFVAVGALRDSGILSFAIDIVSPLINILHIPKEIMPLAILRPISGSASIAVATNIMNTYGVDSKIGLIASVVMGSTETTLYTIAIYTSCIKVKNTRGIIIAALFADLVGMLVSVLVCSIL